jgi:hypothetical protein
MPFAGLSVAIRAGIPDEQRDDAYRRFSCRLFKKQDHLPNRVEISRIFEVLINNNSINTDHQTYLMRF